MKKIFFCILSVLMLACLTGKSQRKESTGTAESLFSLVSQESEKVKIKKEELPATAQKTLDGDAFKGWTLVNAYKTKNGEYEVELKKGTATQSVKFDKEGKAK